MRHQQGKPPAFQEVYTTRPDSGHGLVIEKRRKTTDAWRGTRMLVKKMAIIKAMKSSKVFGGAWAWLGVFFAETGEMRVEGCGLRSGGKESLFLCWTMHIYYPYRAPVVPPQAQYDWTRPWHPGPQSQLLRFGMTGAQTGILYIPRDPVVPPQKVLGPSWHPPQTPSQTVLGSLGYIVTTPSWRLSGPGPTVWTARSPEGSKGSRLPTRTKTTYTPFYSPAVRTTWNSRTTGL